MCCNTAKWKIERDREQVKDHKFDFVDVKDFRQRHFLRKIKYSFVFAVVLKSVLVYIADLWTAGILLIFNEWNSSVKPKIPFYISKWIFLGCIFMSFGLLAWDMKKARAIVASRDISYAFTSIIAYRFYTLRSYSHYCFFSKINNSKKRWDRIAFFVFFTFKGWKRLMFAEAPRQAINAFTLYSILQSKKFSLNYNSYGDNLVQRVAMFLMAFTLGIFVISASLLAFAFLLYLPLLCHIRGNLKEYCCHKIDKRIGELLKKKSKDRYQKQRAKAQAEAQGDYSHLKNKKGELTSQPLREPTLPTLAYFETTHSVPPLPPYQRVPSPVMFEDRNLANSRDPYYVNGGPRAGNPGYGHSSLLPPTSSLSPHYGANAAGQRQPYQPTNRYSNSSLHSDVNRLNPAYTINGYQGHIQSGIQNHQMGMNSVPPRRNYNNLNLVQAAAMNNSTITSTYNDNKSSPSDYENEGKNTEDLSSDDDDDGPPKPPSETNSITPVLAQYKKKDSSSGKHGSSHLSVDVAYQLRSQPNRSSKNNSYNNNNQYLNRHNQYDYLIQPSRSESTTSSIGSNGSAVRLNRGVGSGASNSTPSVSVRYQHEQYPRYDNNNDNNNYYGAKASNQRARDGGY